MTCGPLTRTLNVSCTLRGIPRGYRRTDRSGSAAWHAVPVSVTSASATANARVSHPCDDYGSLRRRHRLVKERASRFTSLLSTGRHADSSTKSSHVTRASINVETTTAEAAATKAKADVASGKFTSLKSRELNEALQYLGSGPNWKLVFDVFDQLVEGAEGDKNTSASPPNAHVATTVLSIAGKHRDLNRVRLIFKWMETQGPGRSAPTAWTYTAYIQAVGGAGEWRDAFIAYREMRSNGITPTSHTYSALIRGGAKGGRVGASAAAALVDDMKADRLVPDVPVASALICAYGVLGQFQNAERMLHAAETAVKASNKGDDSKKPDARLYTEFLIASCRCGRPDAAALVFESENFPRTTYTCTAAIKAYGECDEWRKAEELYTLMTRSYNSGNQSQQMLPTKITHTAMLSAYEKCGEWRRAVSLLTSLRELRVPPESQWNVTMSACGKAGEFSEAERLFADMKICGLTASAVTYSTLISAYGHAEEFDKANIAFKEMLDIGLVPDDYTFVGLMLAPASAGDLNQCMEIKRFMEVKHGVTPTVHVWNECIRAADKSDRYETAVQVYQDMVQCGIEPNYMTRELLEKVGKNGVEYYEDKQIAASFGTLVASLVGVAGMMAGRW